MTEKKIDLRIAKTYTALHQAFTSLLEEKKFEEFTVNELCDRAMIRRTTFYKHFADKYEYFTFYVSEISESFLKQFPPDANPDDLESYYTYMSVLLLQFIKENEKLVMHILESNMALILLELLNDYVHKELYQKLRNAPQYASADANTLQVMAAFCAGGITNAFLLRLRGKVEISDEKLLSIITSILL